MPITESPDHYNFTGASPSREYERLNRNKQLDPMNEPKSETPRTDEVDNHFYQSPMYHIDALRKRARALERELNKANAVINQLPDGAIETLQKWFTAKTERDAWRACAERLSEAIIIGNNHGYGLKIGDDALAEFNKLKASQ